MLTSFSDKYLNKTYYAVHVNLDDGGALFNVNYVVRKKTAISVREQWNISGFEVLVETLKKGIPVILSFTGKKIINKKVGKQQNYLDTILFNKSPDDFYIFEQALDNELLVSLARKDIIDAYIERFEQQKFSVIDFSIGPFILECLSPFLKETESINSNGISYLFGGEYSVIDSTLKDTPTNYLIGDEKINGQNIISFAGLLSFLGNNSATTNFETLVASKKQDFAYRKLFNVLGASVLLLFLFLLTFSYFMQSYYVGKSANIQQELSMKNQQLNQIEILRRDRDYKQSIIENSSLGSKDFLSFYLFEITGKVPHSILLEEINIFPYEGSVKPREKIKITPRKISITGSSTSPSSVNDWVDLLNSFNWIEKTELTSYNFVKNQYVFTLNLFL